MQLKIEIDRESGESLYQQIADQVRAAIRAGGLRAGFKLPATRELSTRLGVHRRTVVAAYQILEESGWVSCGVGQGTFVADRAAETGPSRGGEPNGESGHPSGDGTAGTGEAVPFSWDRALRRRSDLFPEFWRYLSEAPEAPGMIRFTGATADPSFFPADDFRSIVDEVFSTHGARALEYGPAEGTPGLREWVANRLGGRGIPIDPEQVLIVSGSQQGLDLISRLLLSEGDTALVEEPGYGSGFRLFAANGARVVGVPLDDSGIRPDLLDEIAARTGARLLYLMPVFQNPTGVSLSPDRVEALFETCRRRHLPLVEDQFDAELYYGAEPAAPLKSRDADDLVVMLGSFSKILFPGLRLGWMVVPRPLAGPLRLLKQTADFSSSLLAQHAMEIYCRRGLLDLHLERVRRIYGDRLRVMLQALGREFPAEARWTRPDGGLTLWVTLPRGMQALDLLSEARSQGVDFSPGPLFFPNGGGGEHMRLSYIRETEERIRQGVNVLGGLLKGNRAGRNRLTHAGPPI